MPPSIHYYVPTTYNYILCTCTVGDGLTAMVDTESTMARSRKRLISQVLSQGRLQIVLAMLYGID